jgi:hypothetical protein
LEANTLSIDSNALRRKKRAFVTELSLLPWLGEPATVVNE